MMKSQFIVARIYVKERLAQGILQPDDPSIWLVVYCMQNLETVQTALVCLLHEFWLQFAYFV